MKVAKARETIDALLAVRSPDATICPSEVVRAMMAGADDADADGWREAMPSVHEAIDQLVAEGVVQLSWKGTPLAIRAGPYRISRRASRVIDRKA